MSMTLSGNGTITGLVSGGLPDGTVLPADLSTGGPYWDTSGNLGIGTASSYGIGTRTISLNNTTSVAIELAKSGSASSYIWTDGSKTSFGTYASTPLVFETNQTERMRLDASGNLGLGVTPSAWNSATKAIQFGTRSVVFSYNNITTDIGYNTFLDSAGDYRYIASTYASFYRQSSGSYTWFTAPSGTAGNPITFTQAMTLDSSGNLTLSSLNGVNRLWSSSGNPLYGLVDQVITVGTAADTTSHRVGIAFAPGGRIGSGVFANNVSSGSNEDSNLEFYVTKEGNLNSTLAGQFDASGNLKFNSGYGSVATAYGCRAWVNFNGTGTVAIRASGNVSSITDVGTGNFVVNLTTAMPDSNYAAIGGAAISGQYTGVKTSITSTTQFNIDTYNNSWSWTDAYIVSGAVFR